MFQQNDTIQALASNASEAYSPENIHPHLVHMLVTPELFHILHNFYSNALAIVSQHPMLCSETRRSRQLLLDHGSSGVCKDGMLSAYLKERRGLWPSQHIDQGSGGKGYPSVYHLDIAFKTLVSRRMRSEVR
jgi:hypothetical protein